MNIQELNRLNKAYLSGVKEFFKDVENELTQIKKLDKISSEIKVDLDEIWADYEITVKDTKFMLDCTLGDNEFRLAVFGGTKLADKLIKKYKGKYDDIFENYILFYTEDLVDIINFFNTEVK